MRRALVPIAVGVAAAYVVAFGLGEGKPGSLAGDVYGYFYLNILYALRSLAAGGGGLLWTPFQNCGEPFFAISSTGLLYPLNLLFLVFAPQAALRALLFINLLIGGFGAYGLARELGVSRTAALGGALAFVLGNSAYHVTVWMPTVQAPYMWMPVAMWCCERLVKSPSFRQALLLGMVLAVSLLPGHPQFVFFTFQLIALRLLWSLLDSSERAHFRFALGGVALAVVVTLLLVAVQYLPGLEVSAESLRHGVLLPQEIAPRGGETWASIARNIHGHAALAPWTIVPGFIAAAALVGSAHRRMALFYVLTGLLFLALSGAAGNLIGRLYYATPLGPLFREPARFSLITGFCVAVLTSLAIDVLARGSWAALIVGAASLVGQYAWFGHIWAIDWELAGTVLGGGLLAAARPAARPIGAAVIVGTIAFAPVLAPHWTTQRYLADDGPMRVHANVFERLHERLTPQDRVHLARQPNDPGLEDKTATLFEMRAITDDEPQLTRRYAEYITMLRTGRLLETVNQVYFPPLWDPQTVRWPLTHLAAARYIIVHESLHTGLADGQVPITPVDRDETIRVYENSLALPRAYYVPQIAVVPDAAVRLTRLAAEGEDRRRLALVEAAPPSGFLGVPGNEVSVDARFVVDDPERVVLETMAPERGFLFLADQYFPGWSATVNGQPAAILVGNHAFRLVEIPRGPVTVEFRYRSRWLWIGALISGATLVAVAAALISTFRQRAI